MITLQPKQKDQFTLLAIAQKTKSLSILSRDRPSLSKRGTNETEDNSKIQKLRAQLRRESQRVRVLEQQLAARNEEMTPKKG